MRDDVSKQGYSQEEEYFFRQNKELLEKRRKELDAEKSRQGDRSHQPFWMRCPKCGGKMAEIDMIGIKVDQCGGCQGMYFDAGELQTLMDAREPKGLLGLIRKKVR